MNAKDSKPGIEARLSRPEDGPEVVRLLDLNGLPRYLAGEEKFVVVERGGEVLAVAPYRVEVRRLVVGGVVSDPFIEERPLARSLYSEARGIAGRAGLREVVADDAGRGDALREAGYRRRRRGWVFTVESAAELPAKGIHRVFALWSEPPAPFFRGSGGHSG